nr:cellulose binding domain protein [uncultured bacterium]
MPAKRTMAPATLSRQQMLGVAVAAVVLLYLVVGVWAVAGRRTDAVSVAPAQPIFPDGVDEFPPPAPALPPTTGFEEGDPASPTPSGGQSGGESSEGAGQEPGDEISGEAGNVGGDAGDAGGGNVGDAGDGDVGDGNVGGDRDEQERDTPPPAQPPPVRPPPDRPPPAEPPPPPPPPPPAAELFTSRYTVTENGARTFHARVFLTNRGETTRNWSVRITFAPSDQVSVGRTLGAVKRSSGDTFVFSGFNARPGQTEIFGFDATKGVSGTVRPTSCEVDGRPCDIRVG